MTDDWDTVAITVTNTRIHVAVVLFLLPINVFLFGVYPALIQFLMPERVVLLLLFRFSCALNCQ